MRNKVLLAAALVLCPTAPSAAAEDTAGRPNVLIVLADDLGYSDLGCYGGEIETPNLDTLAASGLLFTQFYNTARCWPTRGALMTGYYAQQIRRDTLPGVVSGSRGARPAWAPLMSVRLKALGYRTYHSGKWHIDGKPLANGFDHSYLVQDQGRFFNPRVHFEDDVPLPQGKPDTGYYATIAIADHAIKCLKEHAERFADQPFFHYLCFTAPHFPLQALPEDIARYREKYRAGWEALRAERWRRIQSLGLTRGGLSSPEREVGPPYHFPAALERLGPGEVNRPLPWSDLTDQQREFQATKMAIHAAMIDRLDRELGRVLNQLMTMKAFDNTLILFLSDNGASAEIMVRDDGHDPAAAPGSAATYLCLGPGWSTTSNTPFRRHKTWVHEGGISTPLIAHWPKGISARGHLRQGAGHVVDLVPTVLELAGDSSSGQSTDRQAPEPPGRSLVPLFKSDQPWQRELWWAHEGNRAIRVGDWKLVAAKDDPWELYNLAEDRSESQNLAAQHPDRVRQLEQSWQKQWDAFARLAAAADASNE
jgi:arylsulfatase